MNDKYFLRLGDLATNLFLILMGNNSNIKKVTFHQLSEFEKILLEEAKKRELKFIFVLSRDDTSKFFRDCGGVFYRDDDRGVNISDVITPYHLIYDRSHLPLEVLEVMTCDNVVNKTLEMMGLEKSGEPKKNIYYYLNNLKSKMANLAREMNFEKCMELRKEYNLLNMEKRLLSRNNNTNE
ncbi:MAG: hypothetical protein IKP98_02650 [Bacilli bacterium]|nr:hypothetical protein [Bacilli bacterium]